MPQLKPRSSPCQSGIGLDLARDLRAKGWNVAISGRREASQGGAMAKSLDESGDASLYCRADVASYADQAELFRELKFRHELDEQRHTRRHQRLVVAFPRGRQLLHAASGFPVARRGRRVARSGPDDGHRDAQYFELEEDSDGKCSNAAPRSLAADPSVG